MSEPESSKTPDVPIECGARMARLNIRMPDDLKAQAEGAAERGGWESLSELVRHALTDYLARLEERQGPEDPSARG